MLDRERKGKPALVTENPDWFFKEAVYQTLWKCLNEDLNLSLPGEPITPESVAAKSGSNPFLEVIGDRVDRPSIRSYLEHFDKGATQVEDSEDLLCESAAQIAEEKSRLTRRSRLKETIKVILSSDNKLNQGEHVWIL